MATNITFFETANNIIDIFTGVNTATNSMFGVAIFSIIGILIYIMYQNYGIKRVLIVEGFVLSIVSSLFVAAGWLSFLYVMIPIALLIGGVLLTIFAREY